MIAVKSLQSARLEIKHRLVEIKQIIIYPRNDKALSREVQKILNDIPPETLLPQYKFKKSVPAFIKPVNLQ